VSGTDVHDLFNAGKIPQIVSHNQDDVRRQRCVARPMSGLSPLTGDMAALTLQHRSLMARNPGYGVKDGILAAMVGGATLWACARSGSKRRPSAYWRELRHPNNPDSTRIITPGTINELAAMDLVELIATNGRCNYEIEMC
jgi:hypothetical protein